MVDNQINTENGNTQPQPENAKIAEAGMQERKKTSAFGRFLHAVGQTRFCRWCVRLWNKFKGKHPGLAEFLVFFTICNGVTVLQLIIMPVLKAIFELTPLINTDFRVWQVGPNPDYYIFNYPAGDITSGGGGGLAYFLSVQITLAIAQVINFLGQRNVTFKSKKNVWWAAMWYLIAYIFITVIAAVAQGFYKDWIYNLFTVKWDMGKGGETFADIITVIINSAISFWVFFPILKFIFKQDNKKKSKAA